MNPVCDSLQKQGLRVLPVMQQGRPLELTWDPREIGPLLEDRVIIVLPDIHLSSDAEGDIFRESDPTRHARFRTFLEALIRAKLTIEQSRLRLRTLHLGDFFDVWRAYPEYKDHPTSDYDKIERPYHDVIDLLVSKLDVRVCLGNHDASMGLYPPWWARTEDNRANGRLAYAQSYANNKVLAFHGHQAEHIAEVMTSQGGDAAVRAATLVARKLSNPLSLSFQHAMDLTLDAFEDGALKHDHVLDQGLWAESRSLTDEAGWKSSVWCDRIHQEHIQTVIENSSFVNDVRLLLVGHSHRAGISAIRVTDKRRFIPVVDFGSWAWGRTQFGVVTEGEVSLWSLG